MWLNILWCPTQLFPSQIMIKLFRSVPFNVKTYLNTLSKHSSRNQFKRPSKMIHISHFFFFSLTELESEPSHFAAQVFRPLLCPVGWEEHPCGGDEQRPSPRGSHAPQIRPEGLHLQEASVQEGKREGQAHFQRPGLHARPPGWTDARPGHLQRAGQDSTERLPGELNGGRGYRQTDKEDGRMEGEPAWGETTSVVYWFWRRIHITPWSGVSREILKRVRLWWLEGGIRGMIRIRIKLCHNAASQGEKE